MEDERGDDEYDYEYEDDDIDDDDMAVGMDSGGGASAAPARSAGGASSAAAAEVDLALRDETAVAFVDQAQLKVLMSKVVADIRSVILSFFRHDVRARYHFVFVTDFGRFMARKREGADLLSFLSDGQLATRSQ